MKQNTLCSYLLIIASLAAPLIVCAQSNAAPRISGTYKILQEARETGETQLQVQFHFVNRSGRDLHIQRITLWDFSHPSKGGSQSRSLLVRSAASVDATQEFTVPHAELDLWKRGTRPRVVLDLATPTGRSSKAVVRLDPASTEKGR